MKARRPFFPAWYLRSGRINAAESQLEEASSSCEWWGIGCGVLVVVSVIAEFVISFWIEPTYAAFLTDSAFTDAGIALGVVGEVLFGMWDSRIQTELRRRSNDKLGAAETTSSEANARAGEASERAAAANERAAASEERAKGLEREAEQARLAHERLRAELAWRTISQQSGNTLASVLGAYTGAATIEYVAGDPEALSLAFTLADIFSTAGWNVGMASCSIPNALIFGVFIPEDNGPQRDIVRTAFVTSGLGFSRDNIVAGAMIQMGNPIEGSVKIFIGSKPRGTS